MLIILKSGCFGAHMILCTALKASQNAQHIKPWGGGIQQQEKNSSFHFCQPSAKIWGYRRNWLTQTGQLKIGKTSASLFLVPSTLQFLFCAWLTGGEPNVVFFCCSPSASRFNMVWILRWFFCSPQVYRVVLWVEVICSFPVRWNLAIHFWPLSLTRHSCLQTFPLLG